MHIAMLEALPAGVYALEERRFEVGSFFDSSDFAQQIQHCPVFASLGLHEWSVSHIWRHFREVRKPVFRDRHHRPKTVSVLDVYVQSTHSRRGSILFVDCVP